MPPGLGCGARLSPARARTRASADVPARAELVRTAIRLRGVEVAIYAIGRDSVPVMGFLGSLDIWVSFLPRPVECVRGMGWARIGRLVKLGMAFTNFLAVVARGGMQRSRAPDGCFFFTDDRPRQRAAGRLADALGDR
jgi:hypothetical protein